MISVITSSGKTHRHGGCTTHTEPLLTVVPAVSATPQKRQKKFDLRDYIFMHVVDQSAPADHTVVLSRKARTSFTSALIYALAWQSALVLLPDSAPLA